MKGFLRFIVAKVILLALASSFVSCHDLLFKTSACVAVDDANGVFVNGKFCKDPKYVKAEDFFTSELNIAGNTINRVGSNVTNVNVDKIPGLNTLEVSLVRIDFAPGGQKRNDTFSSERWEDERGCPLIMPEILAFQLDVNMVRYLEARFSSNHGGHY
ncbi:hypothetical protein IGI04_020949 [Brassica rapa subsp. trilocularis]|uniref:Cupin type-1 domain-containing protein n=1 Tax=Brassica rapa subsp. trilocularis TaxID=1813537 RepID=A0ABQ7MK63_BRACM|nr:hypothetical protein IGI04_020949 [Brassica rapa subsp. trilocularis]